MDASRGQWNSAIVVLPPAPPTQPREKAPPADTPRWRHPAT
eukprot:COSAG06_NODE_51920_length_309_cov_0.671429_1_plen_40_part_01